MSNKFLEGALGLAAQGLYVLPLKENGKTPMESGWQEKATIDVKVIEYLWTKHPNANVGILCGEKSNLLVIDLDVKNGTNGIETIADLEAKYGAITTAKVQTPSGGIHLYFKMPDAKLGNKVGILPGVDIRSEGGYVVAPPSVIDEKEYVWIS